MRISRSAIVTVLLLVAGNSLFAQGRRRQIELYAGAGFPLRPEGFKDLHKVGLSLNSQYVFFPSPNVGIPMYVGYERFAINNEGVSDLFATVLTDQLDAVGRNLLDASLDTKGSSSTIKLGIGLRPYLSSLESATQFFLFGTCTFNVFRSTCDLNGGSLTTKDRLTGNIFADTFTRADFIRAGFPAQLKVEYDKVGLAGGAGLELPAGESLNLIIQGLFNVIFTEGESTTFIGVTSGLVF